MRLSSTYMPTLREPPKDAEVVSHALLVRAGFVRKSAAGIYSFLPLALRSLAKIKRVIREELEAAGAQELLLPIVTPAELWQESGRWEKYGPELLRLHDRKGSDFCVGPTHEEAVVDVVRRDVKSYKQLPVNLYQIQTKFRDEIRPRAGLMRGREFIMKDAYSFDADEAGAKASYQAMYDAYCRIFTRLGLDYRAVEADTGNIGGSLSHEFQVLATSGEDSIVSSTGSDFAANVETVPLAAPPRAAAAADAPAASAVATPTQKTIADVASHLGVTDADVIKCVALDADGQAVLVFVRGDREVNPVKVRKVLGASVVELAEPDWLFKQTRLPPGFLGPIDAGEVRCLVDHEIFAMQGAVCGANRKGEHLRDVLPVRDLAGMESFDVRMAEPGDPSPDGQGVLQLWRGIEVGHVFFLGTKYSESMSATFLDANGKEQPFVMGCYGIGVSRILAAAIEQHNDDRGMSLPVAIAPHEVVVVDLQKGGGTIATELYTALRAAGVDAVLDDRDLRPGPKFADADLIGWPIQIVVGRKAEEGLLELKVRADGARRDVAVEGLVERVTAAIAAARTGAALDWPEA
ncbi:MAG: proline--tRNA ligase [Deltaproteobacteria bacterium]|nr:proline--tRNA ligase [Deltaproteobacteria bacterium]